MIDNIFQKIINLYINKKNKKIYYFLFSLFKNLTNSTFVVTFKNYKFYVTTNRKDLSRWVLKNLVEWDKKNILKIINLIKKYNATFIDCGSNFGAYSIPIAKKFKNNEIYSFDASKKEIVNLEKNIKLNNIKNIKYFNFGVGEKNTIKYFNDNIEDFKNSGSYRFEENKTKNKVKIFKLDYIFKKKKIKLKKNIIVKLDIEGYDFLALKGMKEIISKHNVIIFFEFSKMLLENSKNFNNEFNKLINRNNLNLYNLNFKKENVTNLIKKLNYTNSKNETIGDFIISNLRLN